MQLCWIIISYVFRRKQFVRIGIFSKPLVNGFEWEENIHTFNEGFIKTYDEDSNKIYFLEVDVEYPKNLFNLHSDLPFLSKRNNIEKCNKLACRIHVVHIRALKQALIHGLILIKYTEYFDLIKNYG